jgi:hypothetical protein
MYVSQQLECMTIPKLHYLPEKDILNAYITHLKQSLFFLLHWFIWRSYVNRKSHIRSNEKLRKNKAVMIRFKALEFAWTEKIHENS